MSYHIQLNESEFVGGFEYAKRFLQIKFKHVKREEATNFALPNANYFLPDIKVKFPAAKVVPRINTFVHN